MIWHPYENISNKPEQQALHHWQVYIAVATARKVQKASLCTGVKGKKKCKAISVTAGPGHHDEATSATVAVETML